MWPFETAKVGTALIRLLHEYPAQPHVGRDDFDGLLRTYARAHTRSYAEGLIPPHVDEDLHPEDGYWITRRKLHGIHPWPGTGGLGGLKDPLHNRGDHCAMLIPDLPHPRPEFAFLDDVPTICIHK